MVKFKREMNISGRTRTAVLKTIRKSAKNLGMVAENIDAVKRGAMRSGGKQVWKVTATFRDRKTKRRK